MSFKHCFSLLAFISISLLTFSACGDDVAGHGDELSESSKFFRIDLGRGTPSPDCSPGIRHCEEHGDEAIYAGASITHSPSGAAPKTLLQSEFFRSQFRFGREYVLFYL